jgi:phage terminase small subunit
MKGKKRHITDGTKYKLTVRQRKFCELYAVDYNGTQAYKQAYQGVKNDNVASACACRLLRNVKIKDYIRDLESNVGKTIGVSKIRILLEYKKLAFSSIAHLHDTWITRKDFEKLTEAQKDCISEISTETKTILQGEIPVQVEYIKIKLYDKLKALENLNRLSGYDPDKKMILDFDFNEMSDTQLEFILSELMKKIK